MRVLILDENAGRAREAAESLESWDADLITETSPSVEGLDRLERGEWFDLVVADPPSEEGAAAVFQRMGRLSGPPPLLLVSPPRPALPPPPWVQGVLPREPGYLSRLPEAARLTLRAHRLRLLVGHLESQLAFERESAAAAHTTMRQSVEATYRELHGLLHSLHTLVAEGALTDDENLSPSLEAAMERAEASWKCCGNLLDALEEQGAGSVPHSRSILAATSIVREALAVGVPEDDKDRVRVQVEGEGRLFVDGRAVASAVGSLVRASLRRGEEEVDLHVWNEAGRVVFEVPWNDPRFLPEDLFTVAGAHGGEAGLDHGFARLWLPSVREADIPAVLVGQAVRESEEDARPFTLMKVEGCGREALEPGRVSPVVKSADRVLATPDGGLLLLLAGLSVENTWGVAKRVRGALARANALLPFRTLSYPVEASSAREFLDSAQRLGMLVPPEEPACGRA